MYRVRHGPVGVAAGGPPGGADAAGHAERTSAQPADKHEHRSPQERAGHQPQPSQGKSYTVSQQLILVIIINEVNLLYCWFGYNNTYKKRYQISATEHP